MSRNCVTAAPSPAIAKATDAAKARGGLWGGVLRVGLAARAAVTFAQLYLLPTVPNTLPQDMRVAPSW